MKVFPFALIRLAALQFPKNDLRAIQHSDAPLSKVLQEVDLLEKTLKVTKATLLGELDVVKNKTKDYFEKQVCVNLLRDLRQDRSIKIKPRFEFLFPIKTSLQQWKSAKADYQNSLEKLELCFHQAKLNYRSRLKTELLSESIQQGILLSSRSAFRRTQSYLNAPDQHEHKKLRQAELTCLKYYTRAATKTSPFASFGPLAWVGLDHILAQSKYKVNQVLLIFIEEYILSKKDLAARLAYRINPTIWPSGDDLNFLVNHRNIEEIKVLPNQELLTYLLSEYSQKQYTLSDWVENLSAVLEINAADLGVFLYTLVDEGFFLPVMPCSRECSDWLTYWYSFVTQRFADQRQLCAVLKQTIALDWSEAATIKAHLAWKDLIGSAFNLDVEKFYYRDDFQVDVDISNSKSNSKSNSNANSNANAKTRVEDIFMEEISFINEYIPNMQTISFSKQKSAIYKVFKSLNVDQIGLLAFYKIFHQAKSIHLEEELSEHAERMRKFDDKLQTHFSSNQLKEIVEDGVLNVSKKILSTLFSKNEEIRNTYWYGALLQTGSSLPFLRNVFIGHGKMMSRFLNQQEVVDEIIKWNEEDEEHSYVDHSDSSAFNANLHPRLTKKTIVAIHPSNDSRDNYIDLQELYLTEYNNAVVLRSKSEGRIIVPINYGLEGLDRRSPLYQLIQGFGTEVPDFNLFVNRLRPFIKVAHSWGTFIPRIQLAQKVVVQRKQWRYNIESFPKVIPGQAVSFFFKAIHQFLEYSGAPSVGYLRPSKSGTDSKRNSHKPQYFDFNEPTYVLLLKQMLKQWKGDLIWEECYPESKEHVLFEGRSQEWVVEWMAGGVDV